MKEKIALFFSILKVNPILLPNSCYSSRTPTLVKIYVDIKNGV